MLDRTRPPGCPAASTCPTTPICRAGHVPLPDEGARRAVMLVLRFVAAAGETGDACCWDAAFDRAEAAFGEQGGPLLVARAATLIRRLARAGTDVRFLPPPCRGLSQGEAALLDGMTPGARESQTDPEPRLPPEVCAALAGIADAIAPPISGQHRRRSAARAA